MMMMMMMMTTTTTTTMMTKTTTTTTTTHPGAVLSCACSVRSTRKSKTSEKSPTRAVNNQQLPQSTSRGCQGRQTETAYGKTAELVLLSTS
jgi:hypothetical protein